MKKFALTLASILLVAGLALATPSGNKSGNSASMAKVTTVVGYIGDSSCGLKHMEGTGEDTACTLKCVKAGGKFILADREGKVVYQLNRAGQAKARAFAGQQVKVTGRVRGKTIYVTNIEAV